MKDFEKFLEDVDELEENDDPIYMAVIKQVDTGLYFARKTGIGYEFADFDSCTLFFDEMEAESTLAELEEKCPECHILLTVEKGDLKNVGNR